MSCYQCIPFSVLTFWIRPLFGDLVPLKVFSKLFYFLRLSHRTWFCTQESFEILNSCEQENFARWLFKRGSFENRSKRIRTSLFHWPPRQFLLEWSSMAFCSIALYCHIAIPVPWDHGLLTTDTRLYSSTGIHTRAQRHRNICRRVHVEVLESCKILCALHTLIQ